MEYKELFDNISEWHMKYHEIQYTEIKELRAILHRGCENLSEKDVRSLCEHTLEQMVMNTYYVRSLEDIIKTLGGEVLTKSK